MIKNFEFKENYNVADLVKIMEILRGENGCPWDKEQTHDSIRNNFLEEVYEVCDAIDRQSVVDMKEELGDVLLQIVFHTQIEKEQGSFDLEEVADGVCKKLILRHPHIFGDVKADTSEKVLDNWDKIKMQEKGQESYTDTLKSVPAAFPALMRAAKVQKRAAKANFDWEDIYEPLMKVGEELSELEEAIENGCPNSIYEELGDLLFAVVNVSRFLKIDSEQALNSATDKFIDRFEKVEEICKKRGIDMKKSSLEELDSIWDEVKKMNF
ncbi:MAG: nucleoside triphosphate pyrophosphohydrolase [Acutalibacteraceae bacterium]|nr:nucleoside triphosphate pyrophosphohydrolase [Acutalibacteraceae bacterium]